MPRSTLRADVALVSMPWAPVHEPSLGLGILKSCLTDAGITAKVFHFAPELLRWVTAETYRFVSDAWGFNEFVFSAALDPVLDEEQKAAIVDRVLTYWRFSRGKYGIAHQSAESVLDLFMRLRYEVAPKFLDVACDRILDRQPRMVGFTCLFDQTIASLALASRLKEASPELSVAIGGYALEGPPGVLVSRAFPFVDHVVVGDGEDVIVEIARRVLDNADGEAAGSPRMIRCPQVDINRSPLPAYEDWFDDLRELERDHSVRINTEVLPVESSRGCWWGQRKHCVFCGIDDDTLLYRYREPKRTIAMLDMLRERYGDVTFRFSDYIMPKAYYTELLPELAAHSPRFRLHSEIKANHPPERIKLLVDAGFVAVQPGIESFSSPVLHAMDKGVRGIDNVNLLKVGYRERLTIYYNLLFGLPTDELEDYRRMCELMPRLYHLAPPVSRTEVVITRFAPLQADPGRFGIQAPARHHDCYDVLFSKQFLTSTGFALDDYCYYFNRNFPVPEDVGLAYDQLVRQVDHWKMLHRQRFVELSVSQNGDSLAIRDSRFSSDTVEYELSRAASRLYDAIDEIPTNSRRAVHSLSVQFGIGEKAAQAALEELDERRLIWREGDLVLGLALPKATSESHRDDKWTRKWLSNYV
jgi:ribosomal peptide maturation radical SAM protein 1